ncbi:hypothetical protein EMCRGX_G005142 [Ephydatia muelleri]
MKSCGIALIISNITFENGNNLEGGLQDERMVEELFSQYLRYKVVLLRNLKCCQIDAVLRAVSGYSKGSPEVLSAEDCASLDLKALSECITQDHDSFVCCLMSHGDEGCILGTDQKYFDLKNIYLYFGECRPLDGKPKLVFIQACQGELIAEKAPMVEDDAPSSYENVETTPHFMFSYASFNGQMSFQNEKNGSWMVRVFGKLC